MHSRMMGNANEHATTYIYDTVAVQGTISIDLNGITYAFALAATSTCADTDMYVVVKWRPWVFITQVQFKESFQTAIIFGKCT